MIIRAVGVKLFVADRQREEQTNMTKLIVDFQKFAKAPNCTFFQGMLY